MQDGKNTKIISGGRTYISFLAVFALFAGTCAASPIIQTFGVFDVTFYNIGDSDGKYTGEQNWTSEQMADVAASINEWQSHIANTPGRQLQMHMFWNQLNIAGGNLLGGSQSNHMAANSDVWTKSEYIWKTGQNSELGANGHDTIIQFDTTAAGHSWNFGSNAPGSDELDFRSAMTHEIGHSLGWDSTYDPNPRYDDWGWLSVSGPYGYTAGLTAWDKNLVDSTGNKPITGGKGTPGNFNQNDNPVYFDGSNATALYGDLVPVYAPEIFSMASSLIHLDEATFGDYLMSSAMGLGKTTRTLSDLEWAMMEDMGWTIIPEPASILLMLSAIGIFRLKNK
jgi:hypothetical protein